MASSYQAYVGGEWIGAEAQLEVRDPSDWTRLIGSVPLVSADVLAEGMKIARDAAQRWRRTNPLERGQILMRTSALLREQLESLSALLSDENGKTRQEARVEVTKAADFFEYFASTARQPYGELLADAREGATTSVRHEPVGVVVAITPWNDPLLTPARKLAPALAYGNGVVLKPASDTPIIALELTRLLLEAGLPQAVITTVTGRARTLGPILTGAEEVDAITFTGSTQVGLDLQRTVAGRNVRIQCEMGGKNTAIVLADADLEHAAQMVSAAAFAQSGQRCTATSRVIVAEEVRNEFLERLTRIADSLQVGPGSEAATAVGPLVNPGHRDEVVAAVELAIHQGATVHGGGEPTSEESSGCFVRPTIMEVTPEMEVWHTEIFGPVLAVSTCTSLEEAIELANHSQYGLAAALYTSDLRSAQVFTETIDAGQVAVNLPTSGWDVHHPFGGFKLSGSPFKEQGAEARSFYTRVKTCAILGV